MPSKVRAFGPFPILRADERCAPSSRLLLGSAKKCCRRGPWCWDNRVGKSPARKNCHNGYGHATIKGTPKRSSRRNVWCKAGRTVHVCFSLESSHLLRLVCHPKRPMPPFFFFFLDSGTRILEARSSDCALCLLRLSGKR